MKTSAAALKVASDMFLKMISVEAILSSFSKAVTCFNASTLQLMLPSTKSFVNLIKNYLQYKCLYNVITYH